MKQVTRVQLRIRHVGDEDDPLRDACADRRIGQRLRGRRLCRLGRIGGVNRAMGADGGDDCGGAQDPRSQAPPGNELPARLRLAWVRAEQTSSNSTAEPCGQCVPRRSLGTRFSRDEHSHFDAAFTNRASPQTTRPPTSWPGPKSASIVSRFTPATSRSTAAGLAASPFKSSSCQRTLSSPRMRTGARPALPSGSWKPTLVLKRS